MPELPEVETIRRQLEPSLDGRVIERAEVLDGYFSQPAPPEQLERAVTGRTIVGVDRRGKYLAVVLDDERRLVIHLRMTGNLLLVEGEGDPRPGDERLPRAADELRHLRARFDLSGDGALLFTDPRRFGRGFVATPEELEGYFAARLGVEPLSDEFTVEEMARVSAGRTGPLKSFLLNQAVVAGVGNIYADEALFRARLHPLSPAGSMKAEHHEALRDGIVASLEAGLDNGGASIDDYLDANGEAGNMQNEFLVHRREGQPCPRCGTEIVRIVVGGRSTYYCPGCQVRLRRRPRRRR